MNTQTILVVSTSLFTAIISIATMLIVYWQAPSRRTNQLFAIMTLLLAIHASFNAAGRFIDELHADPRFIYGVTNITYAWALLALYLFSEEYSDSRNPFLEGFGLLNAVGIFATIVTNSAYTGPFPSSSDPDGYHVEYTSIGLLVVFVGLMFLLITVYRLWQNPDPRPQAIYPAGMIMIVGVFLLTMRPLSSEVNDTLSKILTFPYNSLSLGIAVLIMARAVLRTQLFDPVRQLNKELQQTNQALEAANRHKDQFLASMSHELRTPLSAIIGYTELVIDGIYGDLNMQQTERLQRSLHNAQHLLTLINDVLDFSKIATGNMEVAYAEVEASRLMDDVVEQLATLAEEKQLLLKIDLVEPITFTADPQRIKQVLINLVGNAIKFTEVGTITLSAKPESSTHIRFSVVDTGIGIPPQSRSSIFEEFRQVDEGYTREYQGTGLGLAIAKRIVDRHQGLIGVESELGSGSTFWIVLPLQPHQ